MSGFISFHFEDNIMMLVLLIHFSMNTRMLITQKARSHTEYDSELLMFLIPSIEMHENIQSPSIHVIYLPFACVESSDADADHTLHSLNVSKKSLF